MNQLRGTRNLYTIIVYVLTTMKQKLIELIDEYKTIHDKEEFSYTTHLSLKTQYFASLVLESLFDMILEELSDNTDCETAHNVLMYLANQR